MLAINQLRSYVGSCIEYFEYPTTSVRDQPDYAEIEAAFRLASFAVGKLQSLENYGRHELPHRQDVVELIYKVRMELTEESGGTPPDRLLLIWLTTHQHVIYSEGQKQAMLRVYKWCDSDRIHEEFDKLELFFDDIFWKRNQPNALVQERVDELGSWARKWLAGKGKTSKVG